MMSNYQKKSKEKNLDNPLRKTSSGTGRDMQGSMDE